MRTYLRHIAVLGLLAACIATVPASAQVSTASRHGESDRLEAERKEQMRLQALFDRDELESKLQLGNGSLRGVMAYRERPGVRLAKLLSRPATALADREWVFLLPMTRYVQAWLETKGGSLAVPDMESLHPEMWKYAGKVRTDRKGYFEFDGLMPGRYLVFAEFPVSIHQAEQVDTGKRAFTYGYYGAITGTEPVYRQVRKDTTMNLLVEQVVDVKSGVTTTYKARIE